MKTKNIAFTTILLLLSCVAFALPAIAGATANTSNNTSNVNVINTPNVNVVNTPTVNVGNTPSVNVTNTPTVQDRDSPARQPFQAEAIGRFLDGASGTGTVTITTVPAGKRLIIEHVSVLGAMLTGQKLIFAALHGASTSQFVTITAQGSNYINTRDYFVASQPLRLYADPGTNVTADAQRNSTSGTLLDGVTFEISGYYIDVP